jgi:hypothetical protein
MGEIQGLQGIAHSAAEHLRESGVIAVAEACTTTRPCPPDQGYICNANSIPVFGGCQFGLGETDFRCHWGVDFYCQFAQNAFDCFTAFECGNWAWGLPWFTCYEGFTCPPPPLPGAHTCSYGTEFTCGTRGGAGYLCPGTNEYVAIVCPELL